MKNDKIIKYKFVILFLFIVTVINAQDKYQEIALTAEEIIYLNENQDIKILIDNYLAEKKELAEDDKAFLKSLVSQVTVYEYKIPEYTEENYPGKEDGLPFEWWKEADKYISFGE